MSENNSITTEENVHFEVREKLPHRDHMLLIDGVAYKKRSTINLVLPVPAQTIFTDGAGYLAPVALIEMVAQLCGAQFIYDKKLKNGQLCGFLVGIDNVVFSAPVRAGDTLLLSAWNILEMSDIQRVRGEIFCQQQPVGQCELTLFKMEQWTDLPADAAIRTEPLPPPHRQCLIEDPAGSPIQQHLKHSIYDSHHIPGQNLCATLYFAPSFIGFSGHFPDYPVLPAVVTLQAGLVLAELFAGSKKQLHWLRRAKFTGPIYPGDVVEAEVRPLPGTPAEEQYSAVFKRGNATLATFRLGVGNVPSGDLS